MSQLEQENARLHAALRDLTSNPPENSDSRATGRTTRLILRGLIALSDGYNVMIIGKDVTHGQHLAQRIRGLASDWNIPHSPPRVLGFGPDSERSGLRGVTLVDHAAVDAMEGVKR